MPDATIDPQVTAVPPAPELEPERIDPEAAPRREFGPDDVREEQAVDAPSPGELIVDELDPSVPQRRRSIPLTAYRHALYYINAKNGKWLTSKKQGVLSVSLFTELYLAADLDAKVFRVTVQGSGFGANVRKDDWEERGTYQDRVSLTIGPRTLKPLWMGGNSPSTENEDAAFTSTAKTTVKVKPDYKGAEAGIDVSSSVSTKLRDFRVENGSDDRVGRWTWAMTKMGGGVAKWTYPYEGPKSLIGFQGWVYPVAPLGRSTLFPACTAFWYAPASFNGSVPFELDMSQQLGYALTRTVFYTGYAYAGGYPRNNKWWFDVSFSDDTLRPKP